jgi:hypothetical protein
MQEQSKYFERVNVHLKKKKKKKKKLDVVPIEVQKPEIQDLREGLWDAGHEGGFCDRLRCWRSLHVERSGGGWS